MPIIREPPFNLDNEKLKGVPPFSFQFSFSDSFLVGGAGRRAKAPASCALAAVTIWQLLFLCQLSAACLDDRDALICRAWRSNPAAAAFINNQIIHPALSLHSCGVVVDRFDRRRRCLLLILWLGWPYFDLIMPGLLLACCALIDPPCLLLSPAAPRLCADLFVCAGLPSALDTPTARLRQGTSGRGTACGFRGRSDFLLCIVKKITILHSKKEEGPWMSV